MDCRTLNTQHAQDCKEVEEAAVSEWKLGFAQAKLKLKEQHYQVCSIRGVKLASCK